MKKMVFLAIIGLVFSSCAYHYGIMTGNAALTNGNFMIVNTAMGTAQTVHVLGIGGLGKKAIVFEAKQDLLRRHPLKRGQALANVTVNFKKTWVLLVLVTKVTVTADIVDFNVPVEDTEYDNIVRTNLRSNVSVLPNFEVGDTVYVLQDKPVSARIMSISNNSVTVAYGEMQGRAIYTNVKVKDILKKYPSPTNYELYGFDVDEKVLVRISKKKSVEGVIFGINSYVAGVKYNFTADGKFDWKVLRLSKISKLISEPSK